MSVPVEKLLCETRRVVTALGEAAEASLAELGVTPRERKVLDLLHRSARGGSCADLSRALLVPVADVDHTVGTLANGGWVEVVDASGERIVTLSAEGRVRWQDFCAREQSLLDALDRMLDEHTVRSALKTLRTIRRSIERCPAATDVPGPPLRTFRTAFAR
jgi:DNA-binding MarR family transcriptional regulator